MTIKLYAVPGSHPSAAVEAALTLKGLGYDRIDLPPFLSGAYQRLAFGRRTVPAISVDGSHVVGSKLIMRALDGLRPEPPLLPADPQARSAVEDAESWGHDVLQEVTRWIVIYAVTRRPEDADSFAADARLPELPRPLRAPLSKLLLRTELAVIGRSDDEIRHDLSELPEHLDRVDELIGSGTLGSDPPNAADLQIGSSVRLLGCLEDLRPIIGGRPCDELARRLLPRFPGQISSGALPADWVAGVAGR